MKCKRNDIPFPPTPHFSVSFIFFPEAIERPQNVEAYGNEPSEAGLYREEVLNVF